jgi:hypothetical protein
VSWLAREILEDRSALAAPRRDAHFFVVTGHDGERGPMPFVESNLPLHPPAVAGELFYGVGAWKGKVWGFVRAEGGARFQALSLLNLPGPGMESVPLLAQSGMPQRTVLGDRTRVKLSRTLGAWGPGGEGALRRMRQGGLVIVGASRNGAFIAEWAARLGVPMTLLDPKRLKHSHLGEISWLFRHEDVGKLKAPILAERLLAAQGVEEQGMIQGLPLGIDSPAGFKAACQAAVLVDAADTDAARLATALVATGFHKVQLSIASGVSFDAEGRRTLGADVRLIVPGQGVCLGCLGGLVDYAGALHDLTCGTRAVPESAGWEAAGRSGSLRSLNQMATGLGLRLLEDLFAGRVTASRWLRVEFDENGSCLVREPVATPASPPCPICARAGQGGGEL